MQNSQVARQKKNVPRTINLQELLDKKSHFLFGPRSTGKSTAITQQLGKKAIIVNLLRSSVQATLLKNPEELEGIIDAAIDSNISMVVIDEIQKVPALLDEVHRLIEERNFKFLLSGSSARKLEIRPRTHQIASAIFLILTRANNLNAMRRLLLGWGPVVFLPLHC